MNLAYNFALRFNPDFLFYAYSDLNDFLVLIADWYYALLLFMNRVCFSLFMQIFSFNIFALALFNVKILFQTQRVLSKPVIMVQLHIGDICIFRSSIPVDSFHLPKNIKTVFEMDTFFSLGLGNFK